MDQELKVVPELAFFPLFTELKFIPFVPELILVPELALVCRVLDLPEGS